MEFLLRKSRTEGRPIRMIYLDEKGKVTERFIRVKRFDDDYLLGYCLMRREMRLFRRDRILALSEMKKRNKAAEPCDERVLSCLKCQ